MFNEGMPIATSQKIHLAMSKTRPSGFFENSSRRGHSGQRGGQRRGGQLLERRTAAEELPCGRRDGQRLERRPATGEATSGQKGGQRPRQPAAEAASGWCF